MKRKARSILGYFLALVLALSSFSGLTFSTALAVGIPAYTDKDVPGLQGLIDAGLNPVSTNAEGILPLKEVYEDYFLIGTTDSTPSAHRAYHYNAFTPENSTKPQVIWANPANNPSTNYRNTVTTLNGQGYTVGHAFNWQNQSNRWPDRTQVSGSSDGRPTWNGTTGQFTPVEFFWSYDNPNNDLNAKYQLERYIKGISEVFPEGSAYAFDAWDVINEMFRDNPEHPEDWRNALRRGDMPMMRPGNWYGSYAQGGNGWDHAYDTFYFARKYFPNTILNYNEFNDEELENKAIAVAEFVKYANARYAQEHPEDPRLLIEMIGIQAHYNNRLDLNNLEKVINIYMETGAKIELTELDMSIPFSTAAGDAAGLSVGDREKEQATVYARLFRLLKKYSDYIHRVTWWGAADNQNWRSSFLPMLFTNTTGNGSRGTPKQAYWATVYPELFLGIPQEPPVLDSFTFGDEDIDVWVVPEYDVNVPSDVSTIDFSAENLVFGDSVDADDVDISVTLLPANGAVREGEPCVATVKLRWKDSPNNADNTTTYKINFGHMSTEWIRDWNYPDTGYRSAVNVRFSDGSTELKLVQEFADLETGEVDTYNAVDFAPLPKHAKGTFEIATDSQLTDEYLETVQLKKYVLKEDGAPFAPVLVGHLGTPQSYWKLNKDPIEIGKTYIIVSSNSGLALTHEGRSSVAAADGTTSAVQGYFGTEIVVEDDIITKTFVAQNRIESPIQDHLRFWIKPLAHPNPGPYTPENGYTPFGLQSLVHGGLIQPYFIWRGASTADTVLLRSDSHVSDANLDRGAWFHTPIDPVTGETTLFLYTPGATPIYYGLAGNSNGFVAEKIADIENPGDVFKVKLYEYVTEGTLENYVDVKLSSSAQYLTDGDTVEFAAAFLEEYNTNTAVATFTWDPDVFEYVSYRQPDAPTSLVTWDPLDLDTVEGKLTVVLMNESYGIQDLGSVILKAKEGLELDSTAASVDVEFIGWVDDTKVEISAGDTVTLTTYEPVELVFSLTLLSNIIDAFGTTSDDPAWVSLYVHYDFNKNNVIDISDIAYAAQKII